MWLPVRGHPCTALAGLGQPAELAGPGLDPLLSVVQQAHPRALDTRRHVRVLTTSTHYKPLCFSVLSLSPPERPPPAPSPPAPSSPRAPLGGRRPLFVPGALQKAAQGSCEIVR